MVRTSCGTIDKLVKDVKEEVLLYLRKLYANQRPQFIYYMTLFHLFRDFLDGTGKSTPNWADVACRRLRFGKRSSRFQKDGAKAAINKILRYNGCILADSVGLGKTYKALAVIKYFELRNERVLVLCPKKLLATGPSTRNQQSPQSISWRDRFRYDVLSHTDLSPRVAAMSGGINLDTLNWGNYDLVVIDESHNFRNNHWPRSARRHRSRSRSRYQRLMEDII